MDRHVAYRDAFDLGRLIEAYGSIPDAALAKAEHAYGEDIARKAAWVVDRLQDHVELREAARSMEMEDQAALHAIAALRAEYQRLWPRFSSGPA